MNGSTAMDFSGIVIGSAGTACVAVFGSNRSALRYYLESGSPVDGMTFPDLLRLADQSNSRAVQALDKMAHYLGRGMRMIVAGLAPERIIVVGDLTQSWQRFGPVIESEVRAQVLRGGSAPQIVPAREDGIARLKGTVALVLQRHFGGDSAATFGSAAATV